MECPREKKRPAWQDLRPGMMSQAKLKSLMASRRPQAPAPREWRPKPSAPSQAKSQGVKTSRHARRCHASSSRAARALLCCEGWHRLSTSVRESRERELLLHQFGTFLSAHNQQAQAPFMQMVPTQSYDTIQQFAASAASSYFSGNSQQQPPQHQPNYYQH